MSSKDHGPSHDSSTHHTGTSSSGRLQVLFGLVIAATVVYWGVITFPGIEKTFSLTFIDIKMIFVSAVLFVGLWAGLERQLFRPYLALIEAREAATSGAEERAATLQKNTAETLAEYQGKLTAARIEAMEKKLAKLNTAKAESAKIVERAEGEAQEEIRKIRWDMVTNMEKMRGEALKDANTLADSLIERIKKGSSAVMAILFALLLANPGIAFAASGHEAATWTSLAWPFANFILYLAIMYFLLSKPLSQGIKARRANISDYVNRAAEKERAESAEYEKAATLLRNVEEEASRIKQTIANETEAEIRAALEAAASRAERIKEQGKMGAIAEQKATESALKKELAELVVKLAKEKLQKTLDVQGDKIFRDRSLNVIIGLK